MLRITILSISELTHSMAFVRHKVLSHEIRQAVVNCDV